MRETQPHLAASSELYVWTDRHSHKQSDPGVGHGVGQTQDAAAHDGISEVEDGHAKGGIALVLQRKRESVTVRETLENNIPAE